MFLVVNNDTAEYTTFIAVASRYTLSGKGTSGGVMVSKLDKQIYVSEFESHWVPHTNGLVPHLSKKLSKLLLWVVASNLWVK